VQLIHLVLHGKLHVTVRTVYTNITKYNLVNHQNNEVYYSNNVKK